MKRLLIFLLILLAAPLAAQEYRPQQEVDISINDIAVTDAVRQRTIPAKVYLPRAASPRPLILFSPGLGGSKELYAYFARNLAGAGYAVIVLSHPGTDSEVRAEAGWGGLVRAVQDDDNVIARVYDISAVIDQALSGKIKGLKVQADAIGVAGHSLGAHTALAIAGQRYYIGETEKNLSDERVKAVVAMSTQRPGTVGLRSESWRAIKVPVLTMTGTRDTGLGINDVSERRLAYDGMPAGNKYHLVIENARHSAFSDSRRRRINRDPRHHDWITQTALAFFDAHLLNRKAAAEWLKAGMIEKISEAQAKIEMK